uniref:Uncharacterized protein n=1 Tax=Hippocampus comes TaxID=109280 RepID=A0A3Q3E790_HIPCM
MDAAYRELYQEFVRLRSLCLRQAALLHSLMTTLQKAKGSAKHAPNPAAKCDVYALAANENTSHPLAEDMRKFSMKAPEGKAQQKMSSGEDLVTAKFCCDPPSGGGSHQDSKRVNQPHWETSFRHTNTLFHRQFLGFDLPSLPGRLLMSDVALQSYVCDFCQAVFPGHTTTRGDFLQHLHNHVT